MEGEAERVAFVGGALLAACCLTLAQANLSPKKRTVSHLTKRVGKYGQPSSHHSIAHVQSYHHAEGLLDSAFLSTPTRTPVTFLPVIVEAAVQLSGEERVEAVTVQPRSTGV